MHQPTIALQKVSRLTPAGFALRSVDLEISSSEIVLVIGHNGAGKSTLLRILSGLSTPDEGKITWLAGTSPVLKRTVRQHLGYFSQHLQLYSSLSVQENLFLFLKLRGIAGKLDSTIQKWGLRTHCDKRVAELSRGLQARVSLAASLAHDPAIVLLDEPTASLDEEGSESLISAVAACRAGHSGGCICVIASHDITRFAGICDRIVLLEQGRVSLDTKAITRELPLDEAKEVLVSRYRKGNR